MGYIHFCGGTGKCFRGNENENKRWRECQEPERPTTMPADETERTWLGCLLCKLYLEGVSTSNPYLRSTDKPYYFKPQPAVAKVLIAHRVPVAGSTLDANLLRLNRIHCGEVVRKALEESA